MDLVVITLRVIFIASIFHAELRSYYLRVYTYSRRAL